MSSETERLFDVGRKVGAVLGIDVKWDSGVGIQDVYVIPFLANLLDGDGYFVGKRFHLFCICFLKGLFRIGIGLFDALE